MLRKAKSIDVSLPVQLHLKRRLHGFMLGTSSGRLGAPMYSVTAATFAAGALSLLVVARPADAQQPNQAAEIRRQVTGSFRFVDPGSSHPITVWFCRTPTAAPDTRIVFVMHGGDSQTALQACDLAAQSRERLEWNWKRSKRTRTSLDETHPRRLM
jgi:hypothetical protein